MYYNEIHVEVKMAKLGATLRIDDDGRVNGTRELVVSTTPCRIKLSNLNL